MKIAVVYNRESQNVINLFGTPNQEKYGLKAIKRLCDSLRKAGHQVKAFEGDKDLIHELERFMPKVLKHERPGMAFNVSYGIQGQARYTHVPSILEMVGIPYVGSGPLAHSLALDKLVAKMIFKQYGLPTPAFTILETPDSPAPTELRYPLIVKPKNEAVSFGIQIVEEETQLASAAGAIFEKFRQPVLVEEYIDGREVNIGLLGNDPVEALPPAELLFGDGPQIYTMEDKKRQSGREIRLQCPAPMTPEETAALQELAIRAFKALGLYDCARVDLRLDQEGRPYILEINSLPSLGEHGSYVEAADKAGLDFSALVNRLVEVASTRYFGTPSAPRLSEDAAQSPIFTFLTERRDRLENRVKELVEISGRTEDPVGVREVVRSADSKLRDIGLSKIKDLTDERSVWAWETQRGLDGGTLLISSVDVPIEIEAATLGFRRDPEWLYGEGVASSRAPIATIEYVLRALKQARKLKKLRLGVLYYGDEGKACAFSEERIQRAVARAKQVLVLRPGGAEDQLIVERRGLRQYRLIINGPSRRLGQAAKKPDVLKWAWGRLEEMAQLSSRKERLAVAPLDVRTRAHPMRLPHQVRLALQVAYPNHAVAEETDRKLRAILGEGGHPWELELIFDRPPMPKRRLNQSLQKRLVECAESWELPALVDSALWPSVAGLVPENTAVMCGLGPAGRDLYTPQESVKRIAVLQRALLLGEHLANGDGDI